MKRTINVAFSLKRTEKGGTVDDGLIDALERLRVTNGESYVADVIKMIARSAYTNNPSVFDSTSMAIAYSPFGSRLVESARDIAVREPEPDEPQSDNFDDLVME